MAWMARVAGSPQLQACFTRPDAFPVLLLPWWLGKRLERTPDPDLHGDVVYSTINACYYVRLIDNIMDGHRPGDATLLPAAAFFHMQFQLTYQRHFRGDHPFWEVFSREWVLSSEAIAREATISSMSQTTFRRLAAEKFRAIKIPIAAVCLCMRRPDLLHPWWAFCDALSRFAQMADDVFDWRTDLSRDSATYFLSEGYRRKGPSESVTAWIIREGFHWGVAGARRRLASVKARSRALRSPEVERYVSRRETLLLVEQERLRQGLAHLAGLAPLLPA